jgi:hypothetical protein
MLAKNHQSLKRQKVRKKIKNNLNNLNLLQNAYVMLDETIKQSKGYCYI